MAFPINKQNIIAHPCLSNYQWFTVAITVSFVEEISQTACKIYKLRSTDGKICDPVIPASRTERSRLLKILVTINKSDDHE